VLRHVFDGNDFAAHFHVLPYARSAGAVRGPFKGKCPPRPPRALDQWDSSSCSAVPLAMVYIIGGESHRALRSSLALLYLESCSSSRPRPYPSPCTIMHERLGLTWSTAHRAPWTAEHLTRPTRTHQSTFQASEKPLSPTPQSAPPRNPVSHTRPVRGLLGCTISARRCPGRRTGVVPGGGRRR
jgi:hypothetical protein